MDPGKHDAQSPDAAGYGTAETMNYWYVARADEIFLDLDNPRAISRAFNVLSRAVQQRDLRVKSLWIFESATPKHVHVVIVLHEPMPVFIRLAWSLWMANDRLRVAFVMHRLHDDIFNADLLVSKQRYHRDP